MISNKFKTPIEFVNEVSNAGCNIFFVHARKAWLEGLNPKQNRTIPPLNYDMVKKVKQLIKEWEDLLWQ